MEQNRFPTYKDHLNKTFLEELSYKIWVTKGARFHANKRLLTRNDLSNKAMGFLSAYLIIFGLLTVYQVARVPVFSPDVIAFSSTAISILLLAFGQFEASADYKMRAHSFHDCPLKLSTLYNEVRIFKTIIAHTEEDKINFTQKLSRQYQEILNQFTNHDPIDFKAFQATQASYFEMKTGRIYSVKFESYLRTQFLYHLLIIIPVIIITYYYVIS